MRHPGSLVIVVIATDGIMEMMVRGRKANAATKGTLAEGLEFGILPAAAGAGFRCHLEPGPPEFRDMLDNSTLKVSAGGMAEPSREPIFRARGLTKIYGTGSAEVRALDGVDLDLYESELIVLLGPSGSGKTTLLNQLGGLDLPTGGELRYRDFDLTGADEAALTRFRRDRVGFIFQFYNLIPSLTARENVALITEIARDPMPPEEALEMVSLGERLNHFPAELSGGEQQRVAIARAIAKRPEILLCDEPTGALDVKTGIVVLEAVDRVNRELGALTVIITHNAVMAGMADRVLSLSDGRVNRIHRNAARVPVSSLQW